MADPLDGDGSEPEIDGAPTGDLEIETPEIEGDFEGVSADMAEEMSSAMPALEGLGEDGGGEELAMAGGMEMDLEGMGAMDGVGDLEAGGMSFDGGGLDMAGGEGGFGAPSASDAGPIAGPNIVMGIPVSLKIVLGSVQMPIADLLKLSRGAIIPLDRKVGDPVDVVVNDRIVARGEVVVVDAATSRFGVSLTEVVVNNPPGEVVQ